MTDNEQLTTDEKLLRLADMIDWLLFHNVVASRRELAKRMKYQESTLSLVVNGKQPISPKFLTALAGVDDRRVAKGTFFQGAFQLHAAVDTI